MNSYSRRAVLQNLSSCCISSAIALESAPLPQIRNRDHTLDVMAVDCYSYPGNNVLDILKRNLNAQIICFYLSHSRNKIDISWNREAYNYATSAGFGFFPTFNGQKPLKGRESAAGRADAALALERLDEVGFPLGSVCYIDIEDFHPSGDFYWDYFKVWAEQIRKSGYYPGIYTVYTNVRTAADLTSAIWVTEAPYSPARFYKNGHTLDNARRNNLSSVDMYRKGIIPYNPDLYPHGRLFEGTLAVQYAFRQFPSVDSIEKIEFDYSAAIIKDPSNSLLVFGALGISSLK